MLEPSVTEPLRGIAPVAASSASIKVVLPADCGPTSATQRVGPVPCTGSSWVLTVISASGPDDGKPGEHQAPWGSPVGAGMPRPYDLAGRDRKSTRLNSSHYCASRMPSSA